MHLWNMNQIDVAGRGMRTATVSVSSDGTNFTAVSVGGLDSNGYFLKGTGDWGYRGNDYTFVAEAKWVRFAITSDWNGNLEYAGLSEVRFIATDATPAMTLTTNTTLSPGDTTYEGADLVVSNCTLTVNGPHGFASLLLKEGAVLTHSPAPYGEPDHRLSLTITNDLTVDATSRIDANARGYATTNGPGKGLYDFSYPSSGGHGGPGGNNYNNSLAGGGVYDSLLAPTQWGSGGGDMGFTIQPGGAGGGVIRLSVGGVLTLAGQLVADGGSTYDSGGAGGSIHLTVGTLAGGGTVSAKGGDASYILSGGGGGGRIAIYYGSSVFSGAISTAGGLGGANAGAVCGGAGTLYTQANNQNVGDLLLDNTGRTNAMRNPHHHARRLSAQAHERYGVCDRLPEPLRSAREQERVAHSPVSRAASRSACEGQCRGGRRRSHWGGRTGLPGQDRAGGGGGQWRDVGDPGIWRGTRWARRRWILRGARWPAL